MVVTRVRVCEDTVLVLEPAVPTNGGSATVANERRLVALALAAEVIISQPSPCILAELVRTASKLRGLEHSQEVVVVR